MTDVRDEKDRPVPDVLGILPLRNAVVFPHAVVPLGAGRASSLRLIEEALAGSRLVGAVLQRDASDDAPGAAGLYTVGTVVVIHKAFKQADGTLRLIVQGLERFRIVEIVQESPYLRARIEHIADDGDASIRARRNGDSWTISTIRKRSSPWTISRRVPSACLN